MHITSWNPSLRSDESTSANNAFELNGFYRGLGSLVVRGRAFFNDGRVREVQQRFQFARASRQNLRLAFTDRYFGRISDQPNWEWTVQVKGSLAEISDIRQVVYHLHPTFPTPDRAVAGTPENGFAFTTIGWGSFPLRATLYFKDSSTAELNGAVQFRDTVRDELSLKNAAKPSGTSYGSRDYYDWTAYLDGPLGLLREVASVEYFLHPSFPQNVIEIRQGQDYGFPLSSCGWGEFMLRGSVHFRNGTFLELTHPLQLFAR